jgi:hypothetical protein
MSRRELAANKQALWPMSSGRVESPHVAAESPEEQPRPERSGIRLGPLVQQSVSVDEMARSANFGEVPEARQLGHDPPHGAVCHAGGAGDLSVRTSHQGGSREQSEEDLKASCLKRAAALEGCLLADGALTLDEHQEGWLIQKRVACRIDEFNAPGSQGIGKRRRYVVCHEKPVTCTALKLMDDGPERRRAQAPLDLGHITEVAPTKVKTDRGIRAMATLPCFPPQNSELQAERLNRLDGSGKKMLLATINSVH